MERPDTPFLRASAGAAALALAMGIGRFAYTALLPSLRSGLGFDAAQAGAVASANLVGYLAGVLWARHTPRGAPRRWLVALGLVGCLATTAGAAAVHGVAAWGALRLLAGVASGLVFVLVSAAVLESLAPGEVGHAGILYSGVGAGMALSGTLAALLPPSPWQLAWLVLGAVGVPLALPALFMPQRPEAPRPADAGTAATAEGLSLGRLGAAYFLEGLGYIVSGTFAVTAVQHTPGLEPWAPWVWVAAGLAAAPSAVLWGRVARALGGRRALRLAFAVQAAGMALPALSEAPAAALLGMLLFGGTFIGIVTLAMDLGRRLSPASAGRTIGSLTAGYGVGQAMGPVLAGQLTRAAGDPAPAVLAAAAAVGLGALLLFPLRGAGTDRSA